MAELFRIRRAVRADAEAIARVHVESWREAYRGIIPEQAIEQFDFPRRAIAWQRLLDQRAMVWVATEDDLVIGFIEARGNEVPVIYLHPGWWHLGIGRRLLRRALDAIGRAGHARAHLWVLVDNARARAFYQRLGGVPGDSRPVQVGDRQLAEMRYTWKLPVTAA